MSYCLLTKPWIPVLHNSKYCHIGLLELFEQWNDVRDICTANPPRQIALYRFLIAIAHSATREPSSVNNYRELWHDDGYGLSNQICQYLDQWKHRFDLIDPNYPFLQDPGIINTVNPVSVFKAIYQDANTPIIWFKPTHNSWMDLADVAQELLRMQSLELGGRKSDCVSVAGGRWTQGRHVFPIGKTLRETLLLNMGEYVAHPTDKPVWEQDNPYGTGDRAPNGYLDWLTYCERRLLFTIEDGKATQLRLASGWVLPSKLNYVYDYHQAFLKQKKAKGEDEERAWYPLIISDPQKQLWEDSESILHTTEEVSNRPKIFNWLIDADKLQNPQSVRVLTFAHGGGVRAGKPLHWLNDQMSISKDILFDPNVWQYVQKAIQIARISSDVFKPSTLRLAPFFLDKGVAEIIEAQMSSLQASLCNHISHRFAKLLLELSDQDDPVKYLSDWRQEILDFGRQIVKPLIGTLVLFRDRAITQSMFNIAFSKVISKTKNEEPEINSEINNVKGELSERSDVVVENV